MATPGALRHPLHNPAAQGVPQFPFQFNQPLKGIEELLEVPTNGLRVARVLQLEQRHARAQEATGIADVDGLGWPG